LTNANEFEGTEDYFHHIIPQAEITRQDAQEAARSTGAKERLEKWVEGKRKELGMAE